MMASTIAAVAIAAMFLAGCVILLVRDHWTKKLDPLSSDSRVVKFRPTRCVLDKGTTRWRPPVNLQDYTPRHYMEAERHFGPSLARPKPEAQTRLNVV